MYAISYAHAQGQDTLHRTPMHLTNRIGVDIQTSIHVVRTAQQAIDVGMILMRRIYKIQVIQELELRHYRHYNFLSWFDTLFNLTRLDRIQGQSL